jgi:hypothetical protein
MELQRGKQSTYPWDEWADGEEHVVKYPDDFDCMPNTLITNIRNRASKMKKRAAAEQTSLDTVKFQFFDK